MRPRLAGPTPPSRATARTGMSASRTGMNRLPPTAGRMNGAAVETPKRTDEQAGLRRVWRTGFRLAHRECQRRWPVDGQKRSAVAARKPDGPPSRRSRGPFRKLPRHKRSQTLVQGTAADRDRLLLARRCPRPRVARGRLGGISAANAIRTGTKGGLVVVTIEIQCLDGKSPAHQICSTVSISCANLTLPYKI